MRRVHVLSLSIALGLASVAVAWQGGVNQLIANGQVVSTNLKEVDGTLMVSVKDVANFMGGRLQVQNGTATIDRANGPLNGVNGPSGTGGVNTLNLGVPGSILSPTTFEPPKPPEPKEVSAKIGENVDQDGLVFQVVGVEEPKGAYRTQNDPRERKISPRLKDERLVVVRMRVENGSDETRRPLLPSGLDVALFGGDGVGVPVIAFDVRPVGNPDLGPDLGNDFAAYEILQAPLLAPKGAFEFAAVFSLPKEQAPARLAVALPPVSSDGGGTHLTVGLK